jgi:hypothetical protein
MPRRPEIQGNQFPGAIRNLDHNTPVLKGIGWEIEQTVFLRLSLALVLKQAVQEQVRYHCSCLFDVLSPAKFAGT